MAGLPSATSRPSPLPCCLSRNALCVVSAVQGPSLWLGCGPLFSVTPHRPEFCWSLLFSALDFGAIAFISPHSSLQDLLACIWLLGCNVFQEALQLRGDSQFGVWVKARKWETLSSIFARKWQTVSKNVVQKSSLVTRSGLEGTKIKVLRELVVGLNFKIWTLTAS